MQNGSGTLQNCTVTPLRDSIPFGGIMDGPFLAGTRTLEGQGKLLARIFAPSVRMEDPNGGIMVGSAPGLVLLVSIESGIFLGEEVNRSVTSLVVGEGDVVSSSPKSGNW